MDDAEGQSITLWHLGNFVLNTQNNPQQALVYLQKSFDILQRMGSPDAEEVMQLIEKALVQLK